MTLATRIRTIAPIGLLGVLLLALSLVEMLLADRKYGLFTGGFGQSRAVDTLPEILWFAFGYGWAQLCALLLAWRLTLALVRDRAAWLTLLHFFAFACGLFLLALIAQYELHSYFSDAVSFTLIRKLGGGSMRDAMLFASSELGVAVIALLFVVAAYVLAVRLLKHLCGDQDFGALPRPRLRAILGALAGFVLIAAAMPHVGGDASNGLYRTLVWRSGVLLLDQASDVDHDGYGLFGQMVDQHPLDPARHPLAIDIPGNGIDEDGFGGDLTLVPLAPHRGPTMIPKGAPNVVLVVFESTRGDALGKQIDGRIVAPNLHGLALSGSAAMPSYSHVGFTTESLKSIFSGQLAPRPGDPSLFTDLKASGYRIGVFSGQPEDFGDISETTAMRRNADVFVDADTLRDVRAFEFAAKGSLLVDEHHLLAAVDEHFGQRQDWQQPVFLYLNFQSPHFPYNHPGVPGRFVDQAIPRGDISKENRGWLERTYWNAVAHSDAALGALVARLKRLGVWDNTILLVSGDHGEDLFEDGFLGHGHIINQRQFATFLAANRPGVVPHAPVTLSDYRGIILDALSGKPATAAPEPAFMYIGELDAPTQIGLAERDGRITALRLDTREACFVEQHRCHVYDRLAPPLRARVDRVVARWGSERWLEHRRPAR